MVSAAQEGEEGRAVEVVFDVEGIQHGLAEVGEGFARAEVHALVQAEAIDHQRYLLAGMVGAGVGGVAAVVGGEQQHAVVAQPAEDLGNIGIERLKALREAVHVVSVAVQRVGIHEVHEHQAAPVLLHEVQHAGDAGVVSGGVVGLRKSAVVEDVLNLAHADHVHVAALEHVQHGVAEGVDGEIAAVAGAHIVSGAADERAGDHASHAVFVLQQTARDAADVIQLGHGHDVLVRGDLEHAVGGGVHDQLAGDIVLVAQLLNDLRAGRGTVANHAQTGFLFKLPDQLLREAVRIGRKGLLQRQPGDFPVSGGGVLSGGFLGHAAEAAHGLLVVNAENAAQTQLDQIGNIGMLQIPHMFERVGAHVSVFRRVRRRADSAAIQHNGNRTSDFLHIISAPSKRSMSGAGSFHPPAENCYHAHFDTQRAIPAGYLIFTKNHRKNAHECPAVCYIFRSVYSNAAESIIMHTEKVGYHSGRNSHGGGAAQS